MRDWTSLNCVMIDCCQITKTTSSSRRLFVFQSVLNFDSMDQTIAGKVYSIRGGYPWYTGKYHKSKNQFFYRWAAYFLLLFIVSSFLLLLVFSYFPLQQLFKVPYIFILEHMNKNTFFYLDSKEPHNMKMTYRWSTRKSYASNNTENILKL